MRTRENTTFVRELTTDRIKVTATIPFAEGYAWVKLDNIRSWKQLEATVTACEESILSGFRIFMEPPGANERYKNRHLRSK